MMKIREYQTILGGENMKGNAEFARWLQDEIEARSWSRVTVAGKAGLSSSALDKVLNLEIAPGIRFARGIAKALNLPVDEVVARAGLLPYQVDQPPRMKALARRLVVLPQVEQDAALDLLEQGIKHAERRLGLKPGPE
jgi:transcriptional regulator with XRE-family HTH domain